MLHPSSFLLKKETAISGDPATAADQEHYWQATLTDAYPSQFEGALFEVVFPEMEMPKNQQLHKCTNSLKAYVIL